MTTKRTKRIKATDDLDNVPLTEILAQLLDDMNKVKERIGGDVISDERVDAIVGALAGYIDATDDGPSRAVRSALRAAGLRLEEKRHGSFFDNRPIAWMSRRSDFDQLVLTKNEKTAARWRSEGRIITPLFPGLTEGSGSRRR